MKKKYLLFAAAAIGLAACSNDEGGGRTIDPDVISFSATIGGPVTRAASTATDLQDTYFVENEEVNVCSAATGETDYTYAVYKAGAASGTANAFTLKDGETALRWPSTGNIDLVAYHPSIITAATTEFAVAIDQSASDGYRGSDLMVADKLENKAKADGAPSFTFHHKLSKVVVNLTPGAGISADDLANTTVRIKTIKTATASEGVWSAKSGESTEWIALGTGASTAAIIVPQSITGTTADPVDFIEIKVRSNPAVVWKTNATRTFAANTVSTYNLTVNMASISLTSTSITGWTTDPTPVTGNQSLPAALNISSIASKEYKGSAWEPTPDVYCSGILLEKDTHYKLYYTDNINPGTATVMAVGIGDYANAYGYLNFTITFPTDIVSLKTWVDAGKAFAAGLGYYVTKTGGISASSSDDAIGRIGFISTTDVDTGVSGSRILVLSTEDVSGTYNWKNQHSGYDNYDEALNGFTNTSNMKGSSPITYPAADAAWNFTHSRGNPTFSGCSNWFLPSSNQLLNILNVAKQSGYGQITTGLYWSSTQCGTGYQVAAFAWNFDKDALEGKLKQTIYANVRAVFAF